MLGIFVGVLIIFFMLGIPVAFAIGYTCLAVIIAKGGFTDLSFDLFALHMMEGVNSFPLLSASFFVLAANVMNSSAITDRIFNFAIALVGHLRGGLGHVNVVASMLFAGMSGTAVADAAGLGSIEIKAMRDAGYPMRLSVGITGASSILGPIIPPSIAMIFYGWLANVSIGELFVGGFLPGIILGFLMMGQIYFVSLKLRLPLTPRPPVKVMLTSFQRAFLSLLTPVIIIGGIYSGLFSPTESGAVASVYAIILGLFIYKSITGRDLVKVIRESVEFTGILMLIMAFSAVYGWLLVNVKIPQMVAAELTKISSDPLVILFLINGFFILVGCFMSVLVAVNILTPILVPVVKSLGVDPIHFGVLMVISLSMGVCTPPFGNVLFVLAAITKQSFQEVTRSVLPYLIPILIIIVLAIFFPQIITFLPRLMR
ncbi:MAG: TRAP transporter large permease [Deltaproteobacteria bacterium]|nr:TRAP transporter large permease [Deltaproteobacteria bacterium]